MDLTSVTYGGEKRSIQGFGRVNMRERHHLRPIHIYHAVPMPPPCHAVPLRF
jgi:hypothetical protein